MNIKGMLQKFWGNANTDLVETPPKEAGNPSTKVEITPTEPRCNVVKLPVKPQKIDHSASGPLEYPPMPGVASGLAPVRHKGLMNSPELEAFFQDNHFGLGRHNGASYRSHEALELGKRSLIARFHNVLGDLIARRQEKLNKMQMELIAIEGVSPTMSAQLRLACEQVQSEVVLLEKQVDLSDAGQGWVLDALNSYQIGFNKGLREALDFELLAR